MKQFLLFISFLTLAFGLNAQSASVRGHVFDKNTGEPVIYGNVVLQGTTTGAITDLNGFFIINNLEAGDYVLTASSIGYDSSNVSISLKEYGLKTIQIFLEAGSIQLAEVNVSARKQQAKTETQVSVVRVTPKQIRSLPSTGGDSDIAQYLTVLPGVVSSGDQGGQIYIRGGSPVQTRVLMDGMNIYRPFHSIGLYSVFETEAIRNVEVHSGGFNAEYGGRISAIVDISTREGDKKRFGGVASVSPFQSKLLLEGPLKKFEEDGPGSVSFILTGKHSYFDETSKKLYEYAAPDSNGLPFTYTDLYGKLSFVSNNGSSFNFFGFNVVDNVNYANVAEIDWKTSGGGMNFNLIPPNSNLIFGGHVTYSNYDIELIDPSGVPRTNKLSDFNINLNFSYFGYNNEVKYGIDVNTFSTQFVFKNFLDITFDNKVNNTDLAGYVKYKQILGNLIIEPGLRLQYYAGQNEISVEPRFGAKWNATDNLRFKLAGGLYSQNVISTVSERDIVNLFVGFLSSPTGTLFKPGGSRDEADHPLQKSTHIVGGVEIDVNRKLSLNVEPYLKQFDQLVSLNRNKLTSSDPDYITETGDAYGVDFTVDYRPNSRFNIWATYSWGNVNRDDGFQEYPANFDRRHNVNFLTSYSFGQDKSWDVSMRWNMGSGFPFTQVSGFYGFYNLQNANDIDLVTGNPSIKPLFSDELNGGRLPYYHRLDFSLKKRIEFSKYSNMEISASVTNSYDRENIFYLDVLSLKRVNQLPIIPAVGVRFAF